MTEAPRRLGPWRVERTIARDRSGGYYAVRRDGGERATLYVVVGEPSADRVAALTHLVAQHRALFHPGLIRFHALDRDGDELYLIADPTDDALATLRSGHRPGSGHIRALGASMAAALGTAHDRGLVHGGLELDRVLWAPGRDPQILGTGVSAAGSDPSAGARGDVAALGRLLCALLIRQPALAGDRTLAVVQQLADPSAALSMRDAHGMLADGDPTQTGERSGRGSAGDGGERGAMASQPRGEAETGGAPARYRILTELGRGGMGEVLLAEDPVLRRAVAIKRIRPGLERDHRFRVRLRREAQIAARLNHRAIVQVFDLVSEGDADYLVMEYVPGPSLHALLGGRPLAVAEVVRIAVELADGLAYAHHHGIIHRDLKLENILIGSDRQPKLTDFGIARQVVLGDEPPAEPLTGGRGIVGTLRAMSPEQLRGHDLDARSDLFSFGVLLYELVTGASPFAADSEVETMLRVLHHRQLPAHELVPGTPRALSDLIDQLLDKSAAQRPDSAQALYDRLCRLALPAGSAERAPVAAPPPDRAEPPLVIPAAGERRQVTLLCVELIAGPGARAPGERTPGDDAPGPAAPGDDELLARVLPQFRAGVDEHLAGSDGALISALGHRMIACFGHPQPLEDAARRAVLAGRAVLDSAAALRSPDPASAGVGFAARGAVHTGIAIAGGASGDDLVLGATLDAGLDLLARTASGQLWLSAAAARLVDGELELAPAAIGPGAGPAWQLVGPRRAITAGCERPLVARDHELQLLLDSWHRARAGHGQVALLVGEPGIGKSRLVRELSAAIAADRPRQVVLRGHAHRQRSALEPATDAISALLAPGSDGAARATTERIRALTGADEAERVLQLLGHPAGRAEPAHERARGQLLCGLRDVLIGDAEAPTLLVVEDLHWLDPSTLDLIALVIRDVAASPVFVVMTTRPGLTPPWSATAITQLRLGRLDASAIGTVIDHACGDRALPTAGRAVIAARSEGVPLFAEELVRAALELGRAGEVPSTLRDALTARLHQLGPAATWVAHVAAVAGREFAAELLAAAAGLDRAAVDRELERLVAAEILVHRRGRARELLYQFGHALLQQSAYDELLAADRRQLHGALADALLAAERTGASPGLEAIAHHLAGARRFDEALAAAARAAALALGRHARVEARELLRQALAWLDQLPESSARDRTEIELRMQLGAVLITTEGYTSPELERSSQRTEALCERTTGAPLAVQYGLFAVRFMRGLPDEVGPLVRWLERDLERDAPPIERMIAHVALGIRDCVGAAYARAQDHFDRAIALFAPGDHPHVLQRYGGCGGYYAHVMTTLLLWRRGRFADARRHARRTVADAEALDPYSLGCALTFEMMLHVAVGDTERIEASAARIHELAARYEYPFLTHWAQCGRGWVLAWRGEPARALAEFDAGLDGIRQLGIVVWSTFCLGMLAESALALGELDRAARAIEDGIAICRTSVDCSHEPELLRLRARLILARDGSARAPAHAALSGALALARRRGDAAVALRVATDLAGVLRDAGRPGEARAVLDPIHRELAGGADPDDANLVPARRLLAALPGSSSPRPPSRPSPWTSA